MQLLVCLERQLYTGKVVLLTAVPSCAWAVCNEVVSDGLQLFLAICVTLPSLYVAETAGEELSMGVKEFV